MDECEMVVIPGAEGEMGVMFDHEMFVSMLKEGELKIFGQNQELIKRFEIKGGFASMQEKDKVLVLVD